MSLFTLLHHGPIYIEDSMFDHKETLQSRGTDFCPSPPLVKWTVTGEYPQEQAGQSRHKRYHPPHLELERFHVEEKLVVVWRFANNDRRVVKI